MAKLSKTRRWIAGCAFAAKARAAACWPVVAFCAKRPAMWFSVFATSVIVGATVSDLSRRLGAAKGGWEHVALAAFNSLWLLLIAAAALMHCALKMAKPTTQEPGFIAAQAKYKESLEQARARREAQELERELALAAQESEPPGGLSANEQGARRKARRI